MNKIFIEDLTSEKDLYFEESAIVIVKNSDCKLNYFIKDEINVFTLIMSSKAFVSCKVECNSSFNMFSFNSSLNVNIDILKDNINYRYAYSTLNKDDNDYQIDINHFFLPKGENLTLQDYIYTYKIIPQVPIVMFAGAFLGRKYGIASILLYILLGLFVIPVFALIFLSFLSLMSSSLNVKI